MVPKEKEPYDPNPESKQKQSDTNTLLNPDRQDLRMTDPRYKDALPHEDTESRQGPHAAGSPNEFERFLQGETPGQLIVPLSSTQQYQPQALQELVKQASERGYKVTGTIVNNGTTQSLIMEGGSGGAKSRSSNSPELQASQRTAMGLKGQTLEQMQADQEASGKAQYPPHSSEMAKQHHEQQVKGQEDAAKQNKEAAEKLGHTTGSQNVGMKTTGSGENVGKKP